MMINVQWKQIREVIQRLSLISWIVLGCGIVAALLIVCAPSLSVWGEFHEPHTGPRSQQLVEGQGLSQTFLFEHPTLDGLRLLVDTTKEIPRDAQLQVKIMYGEKTFLQSVSLREVDERGNLFIWFPSVRGTRGEMSLSIGGTTKPLYLRYQVDETKYLEGEMRHSARVVKGDLAFALHYARPALGSSVLQWGYALIVILASVVIAWALRTGPWWSQGVFERKDYVWAICVGLLVLGWYACWIVRGGVWIGPGDFVKDVSYLSASSQSFSSGSWPVWSHSICGGMPLLGNPESNVLSVGTLLGLLMPAEQSLWIMLALEAGIAAAGSFLLARSFTVSRLGSVLAALVPTLSGAYAYRIVEGFTMIGGAVAFIPWVLLGVWQGWRERGVGWMIVAGAGLVAMFWRGEVHILTGLLLFLAVLTLVGIFFERRWILLWVMAVVGSVFFLGGSVKLLAYAEQSQFFAASYRPYVAPLFSSGILDDVFLSVHSRQYPVDVLHGKYAEEWGNFGAYIGWIVIAAVALGVWQKKVGWWFVIGGLLFTFMLSEGTVFAWWLSDLGPLAGLLRIPTRLLAMTLVFGGIVAGAGVDRVGSMVGKRFGWGVVVLVIGAACVQMGFAQTAIFSDQFTSRVPVSYRPQSSLLALHRNAGVDDTKHAGILLAQGYMLPRLCADVLHEPDFTVDAQQDVFPLTPTQAHVSPNVVHLSSLSKGKVVPVLERFVPGVIASRGVVYAGEKGELLVSGDGGVYVMYTSALRRTEQFLFIMFGLIVGLVLLLPRRYVS